MFRKIKRVDIEFHSKCNRQCLWCPNKILDRHTEDVILDENIYYKTLKELYDNNFGNPYNKYIKSTINAGIITFLGYQEPFVQIDILKKYINIAREVFHDRNIHYSTNSNGDLITTDKLEGLYLNTLNIMDYDCKGKDYWKNWLQNNQCAIIKETPYNLTALHPSINIIFINLNWPEHFGLEDRGGSILPQDGLENFKWKNNHQKRQEPCYEAANYINIYADGSVTPCCHLRPDNINHQPFIMGNLYNNTLSEIWQSEKFNYFREQTSQGIFPLPCTYCQKTRHADAITPGSALETTVSTNGIQYIRNHSTWSQKQEKQWEEIQQYYKRIVINDKSYPTSYYYLNNLLFDKDRVNNLYNTYAEALNNLKAVYEYKYVTLQNDFLTDMHEGIGFDNFSFTIDTMAEQFCNQQGFYQPFFAYKNYKNNTTAICAGRHRLAVMQALTFNKMCPNIAILCLYLDQHTQKNLDLWLSYPKDLLPVIQHITSDVKNIDDKYVAVHFTNYIDLWMGLKIFEREMDFIIEYYYDKLIQNNILPSSIINQKLENKSEVQYE